MPLLTITSPETIRKCSSLELYPSDLFICSYPKSGTTWMQHIILSLLLVVDCGTVKSYGHVSELAPFFEIDDHWEGEALALWIQENHQSLKRRIFNTHLRFSMLPSLGTGGKLVYIVRSPLDVCVSFYHHLSNQVEGGFEGSFEQFFDEWLDGKLPFGSWIHHILSYEEALASISSGSSSVTLPNGRQLLFVSYEDMLRDLDGAVKALVRFLDLNISDDQRAELLPTFSFHAMKADIDRFQPKSVHWKNSFCFLRKGAAGDFKETITDVQRTRFLDRLEQSGLRGGQSFFHQRLREII